MITWARTTCTPPPGYKLESAAGNCWTEHGKREGERERERETLHISQPHHLGRKQHSALIMSRVIITKRYNIEKRIDHRTVQAWRSAAAAAAGVAMAAAILWLQLRPMWVSALVPIYTWKSRSITCALRLAILSCISLTLSVWSREEARSPSVSISWFWKGQRKLCQRLSANISTSVRKLYVRVWRNVQNYYVAERILTKKKGRWVPVKKSYWLGDKFSFEMQIEQCVYLLRRQHHSRYWNVTIDRRTSLNQT